VVTKQKMRKNKKNKKPGTHARTEFGNILTMKKKIALNANSMIHWSNKQNIR
jgi:hypothetical protein